MDPNSPKALANHISAKAITILTTGIAVSFLAFLLFVGGSKNDV